MQKRDEVVMFLVYHRIHDLASPQADERGYRAPSFGEAARHFKIPTTTVFNWHLRHELGAKLRVFSPRWPALKAPRMRLTNGVDSRQALDPADDDNDDLFSSSPPMNAAKATNPSLDQGMRASRKFDFGSPSPHFPSCATLSPTSIASSSVPGFLPADIEEAVLKPIAVTRQSLRPPLPFPSCTETLAQEKRKPPATEHRSHAHGPLATAPHSLGKPSFWDAKRCQASPTLPCRPCLHRFRPCLRPSP